MKIVKQTGQIKYFIWFLTNLTSQNIVFVWNLLMLLISYIIKKILVATVVNVDLNLELNI